MIERLSKDSGGELRCCDCARLAVRRGDSAFREHFQCSGCLVVSATGISRVCGPSSPDRVSVAGCIAGTGEVHCHPGSRVSSTALALFQTGSRGNQASSRNKCLIVTCPIKAATLGSLCRAPRRVAGETQWWAAISNRSEHLSHPMSLRIERTAMRRSRAQVAEPPLVSPVRKKCRSLDSDRYIIAQHRAMMGDAVLARDDTRCGQLLNGSMSE